MQTRKNELRYASKTTYGSVAYDLKRLNTAEELNREQEAEVERRTLKTRPAVKKAAVEETKQGLSLFAILGFAVLTALLVMVLMSYVQLTQLKAESSKMHNQLNALQTKQAQMTIKYENTFNMTDVEAYAENVLGMSKASDTQVVKLDDTKADKAVVLSESTSKGNGIFRTLLTSVVEYFK